MTRIILQQAEEREVKTFSNSEFGNIRVIEDAGKTMFCGKDVATALGYSNPNKAVRDHTRGERIVLPIKTDGGTQQMQFITEGDMYRLIASSKLESAQRFESWVFDEVLPAIRRDGGYMVARDESPEQTMARAVLIAQSTIERQKSRIAELEPKAMFADAVAASDGTCLVGELAKMMTQAGFKVGQNRLFAILRDDGYLGKSGSNKNVPLQRYVEQGLFRIKETAITHADGHVSINRTTKVTGKGQRYFIDRYCKVQKLA